MLPTNARAKAEPRANRALRPSPGRVLGAGFLEPATEASMAGFCRIPSQQARIAQSLERAKKSRARTHNFLGGGPRPTLLPSQRPFLPAVRMLEGANVFDLSRLRLLYRPEPVYLPRGRF